MRVWGFEFLLKPGFWAFGCWTPKAFELAGSGFLGGERETEREIRLMDKILHDPNDPKLWELWYIPYNG